MTPDLGTPTGEARLKARQNKFVRYMVVALIIGMTVGFASGFTAYHVETGRLPAAVLIALWALTVALFGWFTRDYFRRIDELDLLDNLWASTIGLYVYIVALGSWWLFHDVGLMPEPNQYIIAAITLVATTIAYLARKAGLR